MAYRLIEPDELARRIRMIMGGQKMSRKRLAEKTDISRPSLANKLDGKVAFTYDELLRVVAVLGVAWDELLARDVGDSPLAETARAFHLSDFRARPDLTL